MRLTPNSRRALLETAVLVSLLPAVAGVVNAAGLYAVGTYTSHVTGDVARAGEALARGELGGASFAAACVLEFFAGAFVATVLVQHARARARARFAPALLVEALALAAFAAVASSRWLGHPLGRWAATGSLCFAMGLQNALVTKVSNAVVRTTHLTGVVTDLAIELGRTVYSRTGDARRTRLLAVIAGSFGVGAVAGPLLYVRLGAPSTAAPVGALLLLAALDARYGLSGRPFAEAVTSGEPESRR